MNDGIIQEAQERRRDYSLAMRKTPFEVGRYFVPKSAFCVPVAGQNKVEALNVNSAPFGISIERYMLEDG